MASTVAITAVVVADLGPPLAPIVALWFVFVCPGLPYVRLLGLKEPLNEMLLAVALSLSIHAVVSLLLQRAAVWTSTRMLAVMVVITLLGVLLDGGRSLWRWRPST